MNNKKKNDMEMMITEMNKIIKKRHQPSFSQRLGDLFSTLLSFIIIVLVIFIVMILIVILIKNPLSLLILFVGITLLILTRSKNE